MKTMIGFWLICLAITLLIISIEPDFDFKEKVKQVCFLMLFITLLMVGCYFMVGSEV